jgi:hypothetical protein
MFRNHFPSMRRFPMIWLLLIAAVLSACSAPVTQAPAPPTSAPAALPSPTAPISPAPTVVSATSAPTAVSTPAATTAAFTDPFVYCAAVGNADTPGAEYTGPKLPDPVLSGLKKAAGMATDVPNEVMQNGSFWRCMGGKVYACFVGANLPCDGKANTDQTPSAAEAEYCKANPAADDIPAATSGHDSIYAWRCSQGKPQIAKQVFQVDPRGFIAEVWYAINPQ